MSIYHEGRIFVRMKRTSAVVGLRFDSGGNSHEVRGEVLKTHSEFQREVLK